VNLSNLRFENTSQLMWIHMQLFLVHDGTTFGVEYDLLLPQEREFIDWWSNEICSNSIRLAQLIASRVQTLCASFAVKQMLLSSKVLLIMIGQQHEHFTHNWLRLSSSLFTNFHSICCVCTSTFLGVSPPLNSTCKFSDPFAASTIQDLKLVAVCDQWLAVVVDLCL
jgi:hypothetical protein